MTKIFVTGATGFIGGDALYEIATAHPEYDITCLVRNSDKGARVAKDYAKIKLVYGDLDKVELIEEESKNADIVCNFANADHKPALEAIIRGLAARDPSQSSFLIHTSGTGILMWDDISTRTVGESSSKVYDDLEGVSEVTSFADEAPHRVTDKLALAAGAESGDKIKTAIVCPGTIYGQGRGPDNQRSHQVPELARCTLEKGHGFKVLAGKTLWNNIHVYDLSDLYLKLVETAAAGGSRSEWPDKPDVWGHNGYFFCENGEHCWGDVSQWVASEAHNQGLIETDKVQSISADEAGELTRYGQALWGCNSRARAKRARAVLNWKPKNPSLKDEIKATVEVEARKVKTGHAKIAAGDA